MAELALIVFLVGVLAYSLVSGKLNNSIITVPLIFILFGWIAGPGGIAIIDVSPEHGVIDVIFEVTLVVILFSDASRIDLKLLITHHNLPQRLLVAGMPLTIIFGALAASLIFGALSLWEAVLLAAILAPTDAALGQSVVSDSAVPARIRQTLNVESGLNDGIALPVVLILAALDWGIFGGLQVTLCPVIGGVIGYTGAKLIDRAAATGWMTEAFEGISLLTIAALAFLVAEISGGNGFISAFVAGLLFGNTVRHKCSFLFAFMETEGQLLTLITFFLFGVVMLPEGLAHVDGAVLLYAILSLTILRMIPVALSLIGTKVNMPTYLFLGWFGPRGIASILFALIILERADIAQGDTIFSVTVVTVALSALLHGVTAAPLAKLYGRKVEAMGECEETKPVSEMPLRHGN
jgi:NhaP-type Na+/H+ or K+/H+ antiporter